MKDITSTVNILQTNSVHYAVKFYTMYFKYYSYNKRMPPHYSKTNEVIT